MKTHKQSYQFISYSNIDIIAQVYHKAECTKYT